MKPNAARIGAHVGCTWMEKKNVEKMAVKDQRNGVAEIENEGKRYKQLSRCHSGVRGGVGVICERLWLSPSSCRLSL